ncbi:MAG: thymidylate synthase [Candidatus Colwellbacteria bacterium]|nr:thymidylate synthase [Candidatus Colwellbacteria bacterium]
MQHNKRRESSEYAYLSLVKEILETGEERGDRTGTGTISVFGPQVSYDIREFFPLISTKTVGLKTIFEELIWMLRGQTNNNTLKRKKVNIWTENSDSHHKKMVKRQIEKNGVSTHVDGDMGPLYGYQWRSFGGDYKPVVYPENATEDEKIAIEDKRHIGEGFDQIAWIINEIRTNPESRRIKLSAWNPKAIDDMALPPCHDSCTFYVSRKKYLHCKLHMRSNDIFLGAPFNIGQYALLTYMIASMTGYVPGNLIHTIDDAHIYSNHVEQMKQQLLRPVRDLPTLKVLRVPEKIEEFEFSDFKLSGSNPHPSIKGDMAV